MTLTRHSVLSTLKAETALKIEIRAFETMGENDGSVSRAIQGFENKHAHCVLQSHERSRSCANGTCLAVESLPEYYRFREESHGETIHDKKKEL